MTKGLGRDQMQNKKVQAFARWICPLMLVKKGVAAMVRTQAMNGWVGVPF